MPPGNMEAMVHYEDTIRNGVSLDRILPHVPATLRRRLQQVFGLQPVAVWGSRDSSANRAKFERMNDGDEILIVEDENIKLLGRVAGKLVSPSLSSELWKNIRGNTGEGWNLVYFIANPEEIDLPFTDFCRLLGYRENLQLRGLTRVADARLATFYAQYDDLYSILLRLKKGDRVQELPEPTEEKKAPARDEEVAPPPERELSDHVRMQWLLSKMGRQAGQTVWVPKNDQQRIISEYHFEEFPDSFSPGLDTEAKYVRTLM